MSKKKRMYASKFLITRMYKIYFSTNIVLTNFTLRMPYYWRLIFTKKYDGNLCIIFGVFRSFSFISQLLSKRKITE